MTWAVAWRPLAERDLIDCAAHIAQDNIDAAVRFIDAVEETVTSLAESPMLSTATYFAHPDLAGIRRRVVNGFKCYPIFYDLLPQRVSDAAGRARAHPAR